MSTESITTYNYYIEKYKEVNITVSSAINYLGEIYKDDNDNKLAKAIHTGSNYINKATYGLSNPMIIYDDINYIYIDGSFDEDDIDKHFLIKPLYPIFYKANASKITNPTVANNKLQIDLSEKKIFRVIINSNDVVNYASDIDGITINAPATNYLTGINDDIIVYLYDDNQTVGGNIVFKYDAVEKTLPKLSDLDGSYLIDNTFRIKKFNSFSVDVGKDNQEINDLYSYVNDKEETSRASTISIPMHEDIRSNIKDTKFRIIGYDKVLKKMKMFSNCQWDEGESINSDYVKNIYNYTIEFEDEIIITYVDGEQLAYGEGTYGEGYYGELGYEYENVRL